MVLDTRASDRARAAARRGRARQRDGPGVRGRSDVAEADAERVDSRLDHGRRRRRAGSHLGRASRRGVADGAHGERSGHGSADGRAVLPAGAAGAGVRSGRAISSARGAVRVRAMTGRRRRAASPSIRRATSGSRPPAPTPPRDAAAVAVVPAAPVAPRRARLRRHRRRHRHHRRRPTPTSSSSRARASSRWRSASRDRPAANDSTTIAEPAGESGLRCHRQRGVRRRRLRQPPRDRVRRGDRRLQAALGRLRRRRRATTRAPYDSSAPPAKQFRTVTCASVAKDGTVYVCDRTSNRIQVFAKDGKFLKEAVVAPATLGSGAVWDIAFSADPQQQLLFVADGQNQRVTVLVRDSLAGAGEGRHRRPVPGPVLRRVERRGGLARQSLHGRRARRETPAEVEREDQ